MELKDRAFKLNLLTSGLGMWTDWPEELVNESGKSGCGSCSCGLMQSGSFTSRRRPPHDCKLFQLRDFEINMSFWFSAVRSRFKPEPPSQSTDDGDLLAIYMAKKHNCGNNDLGEGSKLLNQTLLEVGRETIGQKARSLTHHLNITITYCQTESYLYN